MPSGVPSLADFAIITALEEERDALLSRLAGAVRLDKGDEDVSTVFAAEVETERRDGAVYRVVVSCLGGMGPIVAAAHAGALVRRHRPARALMVGIGGGVAGEAELGDVLVGSQIADYTVGKDAGGARSVRWQVHAADAGLLDSAVALGTGWEEAVGVAHPGGGVPRRRVGVIASGGDVIASGSRVAELRAAWPKLVGVDMEGGGVATALGATPERPPFLMVRGVSDLADEAKHAAGTRAYRGYASAVAAAYAVALLRGGPVPAQGSAAAPEHGPAEREDVLLERLQQEMSVDELGTFIRRRFREIPGGLAGIVAPVHDFRHQTAEVVDYFKRRRQLDRLEAALDTELGPRR